ncbi:MAG: hypothetical protein ACOYBP_09095 [Microbacteriaceae bacterium]
MDIETDRGFAKRELRIDKGQHSLVAFLPAKVSWGDAAGAALDRRCTEEDATKWIVDQATAQVKALGFDPEGDIPAWAMIPATFTGHHSEASVFLGKKGLKNSGYISYAEYPASVLAKLPPTHPRVMATKLPGKWGENKARTTVYFNVLELPTGKQGVDENALRQMLTEGGFVKVFGISAAQYANLRETRDAIAQMGFASLAHVHILVKRGSDDKGLYLFTPNTSGPATWRKPEFMKLVLQELERIEPLAERAGIKHLNDEEFAALYSEVAPKAGPAA